MKLKLTKPIAFVDLETTGITIGSDRIVEISIVKLNVDGTRETYTKRVNPEMPIPAQSSAVHGIFDKDVIGEPNLKAIANEIKDFIGNADLGGYNSNRFDIPLLVEELFRVGVEFNMVGRKSIDVQSVFYKKERRTLEAAVKFYCDKDLTDAHSAEADIMATIDVLESQLDKYDDLEPTVEFLSDYTRMNNNADLAGRISFDDKGVEVFNFGKHKGKSVQAVFEKESSYYDWMMRGEFPQQTKQIITAIRLRSGIGKQGKLI